MSEELAGSGGSKSPDSGSKSSESNAFGQGVWVALIGSFATVLVALIGLVGNYFSRQSTQDIVSRVGSNSTLFVGVIVPYAGNLDDKSTSDQLQTQGWLPCRGQFVGKDSYPELFKAIGFTYGKNNREGDFRLPDLRERVVVGISDSEVNTLQLTLGRQIGDSTATLIGANLPPHKHVVTISRELPMVSVRAGEGSLAASSANAEGVKGMHDHNATVDNGPGTSQPFSIVQPSLGVNFLIRCK